MHTIEAKLKRRWGCGGEAIFFGNLALFCSSRQTAVCAPFLRKSDTGYMATLHMSEAEVARDLHAVLAKVRQGVEIVIEQDDRPVAVLTARAFARPGRKLSECIAMAKEYEAKLGFAPIPDADFEKDVQAGIDGRRDSFYP